MSKSSLCYIQGASLKLCNVPILSVILLLDVENKPLPPFIIIFGRFDLFLKRIIILDIYLDEQSF